MDPLKKVIYTDKQTPITAKNLNEIQDTIIALQEEREELIATIEEMQSKLEDVFVVE